MVELGRPLTYSAEVAESICAGIAEGMTLRQVCRLEGMPPESTVRRWVLEDRQGFSAQYTRAREMQMHAMADELVEIADEGKNDWMNRQGKDAGLGWELNGEHIQRSRARIDARKWLMSKVLPKDYGDKTAVEHSGKLTLAQLVTGSLSLPAPSDTTDAEPE